MKHQPNEEMKFQCPYCGAELSEEANFCCGEAGHGEWVVVEPDPEGEAEAKADRQRDIVKEN